MTSQGIKMAAQKFAQEVPKIATLEACRIGLNWPISILFAANNSARKVLSFKPIKKGSKISFQWHFKRSEKLHLTANS